MIDDTPTGVTNQADHDGSAVGAPGVSPPLADAAVPSGPDGLDRSSAASAQAVIERMYPDPTVREMCLNQLVDSIVHAHTVNPASWGVTLFPDCLRLNVGRIETCVLFGRRLYLVVDAEALSPTAREALAVAQQAHGSVADKRYKSFPSARTFWISTTDLPDTLAMAREAHRRLVEQAARTVRTKGNLHFTHSPGVVAYLRTALDRDIPDPVYAVSKAAPRAWLFQANPAQYDLRTHARVGGGDWWAVASHRDKMQPGDGVVFWHTGSNGGICAVGRLTGEPYPNPEAADGQRGGEPSYRRAPWRVDVRYETVLAEPIPRTVLKSHPVLSDLEVLRAFRRTVSTVTPEQWEAIAALLRAHGVSTDDQVDLEVGTLISSSLAAAGLCYTSRQIATFYTALQTKGFVILSGISGTGKTKLAQHFASLLPNSDAQPSSIELASTVIDESSPNGQPMEVVIFVRDYMRQEKFFVVPKRAYWFFDPPLAGQDGEIDVDFDGARERCRLRHRLVRGGPQSILELMLRGRLRAWFTDRFAVGDRILVTPEIVGTRQTGVRIMAAHRDSSADAGERFDSVESATGTEGVGLPQVDLPQSEISRNVIFLSVRPDWRDSKSLLGYHNPLTGSYEWTPFLRFLLQASESYRRTDGIAWFVVLDEMNLAHVEHYFADLLSVLESGRDEEGWTREPLRLGHPDDELDADRPPHELRLPPNLYVVGTVNVDETTHAFSPKVLDRAFTMDLTEVDFRAYPPALTAAGVTIGDEERRALLTAFTRNGRFARIDKREIVAFVATHPEVRDRLARLNESLRSHHLHFGYRVFDETVAFLANAERNGLFAGLGELAAFDAAALMKVLPKFHGSRGKLERPLRAVFAWSLDPDAPDRTAVDAVLNTLDGDVGSAAIFAQLPPPRLPQTADRAARMLLTLYADGFAAF